MDCDNFLESDNVVVKNFIDFLNYWNKHVIKFRIWHAYLFLLF